MPTRTPPARPEKDTPNSFFHHARSKHLLAQPNIQFAKPHSRTPKPDGEDVFWGETLSNSRCITSVLALWQEPVVATEGKPLIIDSATSLVALGDGLNGWPGVLHGGVVATVLDEAMGTLQGLNIWFAEARRRSAATGGGVQGEEGYPLLGGFTADLRITYLAPVVTPGVIEARVWFVKREGAGKKEWIHAEIWQNVDFGDIGEGKLCARGEALFIRPKKRGGKL